MLLEPFFAGLPAAHTLSQSPGPGIRTTTAKLGAEHSKLGRISWRFLVVLKNWKFSPPAGRLALVVSYDLPQETTKKPYRANIPSSESPSKKSSRFSMSECSCSGKLWRLIRFIYLEWRFLFFFFFQKLMMFYNFFSFSLLNCFTNRFDWPNLKKD